MTFWPKSIEHRAALRTACAALIAMCISFSLHLQTPYWSGMTVVIVANLYTGSIIDKATMRIIGTIGGAVVGFFIAGLVVNSFLLYLLSSFLIIAICVYYYNLSRYGYAYLLAALCAFLITAQLVFDPLNAFYVAIWRPVEIGIGVMVSALSAYCIVPNHLKDAMVIQIQGIFEDFSAEFKQLSDSLKLETVDFTAWAHNNVAIKRKLHNAVDLLGALNHEIGVSKARVDQLRAFLNSFYDVSRQLQYLMITAPHKDALHALSILTLEPLFSAIQDDLALLQTAFIQQLPPVSILKTTHALQIVEQQWNQRPSDLMIKSDFIYSFIHFLEQIAACFSMMYALLAGSEPQAKTKVQLMSMKQLSDWDSIKHSIRAGSTVIVALLFWMLSNWPGGLNGIISSLIISIRKNLTEMSHISVHRVLGCCLGGGVALVSLRLCAMNLYDLGLILSSFIWLFSFLMFKYPQYTYIGLQANVALILSLAQEGGPPAVLAPPLQRLSGIFIGILSSFLVANVLWRVDAMMSLKRYLARLYDHLSYNVTHILSDPEQELVLYDLANIFWLSRGLIESLTNAHLNTRKQHQLRQLSKRFESLVFIQATLSHIVVAIDRVKAKATAARFDVELSQVEKDLIRMYREGDRSGGQVLSQHLQKAIFFMEAHATELHIDSRDLRNNLAYINALNHLALRVQ